MMHKCGIYCITNIRNGKVYIGSAALSFEQRWRAHRSKLKNGKHKNRHLQSAWDKYGEDAFRFDILLVCLPESVILYEQLAIDAHRACDKSFGYNMLPVAGSRLGSRISAEQKAQASARFKGIPLTAEHRAKIAAAHVGKTVGPATRVKISIANKRRKFSPEKKAAIAAKLSAKLKGLKRKPFTAEHRAKLSAANKGKSGGPRGEAFRRKCSLAKMGHSVSDEAKQNMRIAAIRAWDRKLGRVSA